MTLRPIALVLCLGLLSGCGAEAVGTAATGATIKQKELQAGQAAQQQVQQQLQQGLDLGQQRNAEAESEKR